MVSEIFLSHPIIHTDQLCMQYLKYACIIQFAGDIIFTFRADAPEELGHFCLTVCCSLAAGKYRFLSTASQPHHCIGLQRALRIQNPLYQLDKGNLISYGYKALRKKCGDLLVFFFLFSCGKKIQ